MATSRLAGPALLCWLMSYRLIYWRKRGRAEQIRLLLSELGADFEESNVSGAEFRAMKSMGPSVLTFGSVPMLEDGDFKLCQAPVIMTYLARKHGIAPDDSRDAAKAEEATLGAEDLRIAYFKLFGAGAKEKQAAFASGDWCKRWLPAFEGLLQQSGGFTVGASLTQADVAVWDALDSITTWISAASLDGFPSVQKFSTEFAERPRIAAYLRSDRRPEG